uniref:Uncharacterized protein n=1 Tax=Utricularia reniformis TaxID=192314 RepID=A0A1Y0B1X0_9LAMI|nr:hypothetical protein AEK19_MT1133 [Utricularia reniformis]ART31349.1 hypothetical protein AEK19_MT1133 [Utricularia reniformis]
MDWPPPHLDFSIHMICTMAFPLDLVNFQSFGRR